jgi:site-specific recombinase XerD
VPGSFRELCRFATHFLEGGGSVTDLMTQLGHSRLETTQIYAAAVSERRRATVMALEFSGSMNPVQRYIRQS